jgi:hypothetical protein
MKQLGRLKKVPLREFWTHEASDFTPWLAREGNIALLSETLNLELMVEAQEKHVGPFRADILCKDSLTNAWVLIENQLERTDHSHLGQLLTYAAGLQAATIIWLAERFTEEHRATLDWLNEITDERFNFFGVEIELWQIDSSPLAPNFNLVSKPNNWSRQIKDAASQIERDELTPARQFYVEYWTVFRAQIEQRRTMLRAQKPLPQNWMNFAIGRSNFLLTAWINQQKQSICVNLVVDGPDGKAHYRLLERQHDSVEQALGAELVWNERPHGKQSYILLYRHGVNLADRAQWPEQHTWLIDMLERFHRIFAPLIKQLNAADNRDD